MCVCVQHFSLRVCLFYFFELSLRMSHLILDRINLGRCRMFP